MSIYMDVQKKLGSFTLNMQLESGDDATGILGSSGSGKSMTLRTVAGIVTPDSGEIVLNGKTLFHAKKKINLTPQQRGIGLMFQSYALFPNMTVEQNIAAGIKQKTNHAQQVQFFVKLLRLHGLEQRYPSQLSGGQQQRVALARMMASDPAILMLDEPFSALDRHLRFSIEDDFASALEQYHGTVLYVSHNVGEVYQYCENTVVLSQGSVVEKNKTSEIFHTPATVEAARLIGCKNISAVTGTSANTLFAREWKLPFTLSRQLPSGVVAVGLRENSMTLAHTGEEGGTAVRVRHVKQFPQYTVLSLGVEGAEKSLLFSCPKAEVEAILARSKNGQLYVQIVADELLLLKERQK